MLATKLPAILPAFAAAYADAADNAICWISPPFAALTAADAIIDAPAVSASSKPAGPNIYVNATASISGRGLLVICLNDEPTDAENDPTSDTIPCAD